MFLSPHFSDEPIIFGKKRQNVWFLDAAIGKGIPGDTTRLAIKKALGNKYLKLLDFKVATESRIDKTTGEECTVVSPSVANQPYYQLWHCIYSIPDPDDLKETLTKRFGITDEQVLDALSEIDFVKQGYGNISVKAIRKALPYLMSGMVYSSALEMAGFRHSDYLTKEENQMRQLKRALKPLKKGELRQPIVEKILNNMVGLVNQICEKFGPMDEIVVELARELKQSREERSNTASRINKNEATNKRVSSEIQALGLTPTMSRVVKYKLWEESNKCCIYCGDIVNRKEFLMGFDAEVEHIIPKSLIFDDSYSNKACSCRKCNREKGNQVAYEFMLSRGQALFDAYVARVNELYDSNKISKTKRDNLLRHREDIPTDFINRQMRETQYISRKALEMLKTICRDVRATSGSVTDFLRHTWGWDRILHDLDIARYRMEGRTEQVTIEHRDNVTERERIIDWSKRLDHRHHAIDALVIACTTQAFVQRLNNLSANKDVPEKPFFMQSEKHQERQTLLERYALAMPHFTTADVTKRVSQILIPFKPAAKLVSHSKRFAKVKGTRRVAQTGILVPRGQLHEQTIYGKISVRDKKNKLREEVVVKYKIEDINTIKAAESIVDKHIRELVIERIKSMGEKRKDLFTDANPLYSDPAQTKRVRSVRCFTGNTNTLPIRYDNSGKAIGFANPGANYHVAIYEAADGTLKEHVATFFHCVERRLNGLPPIITDPKSVWDSVLQSEKEFKQDFLAQLPDQDWRFKFSMQRGEMFVLGMEESDFRSALEHGDIATIGEHLYRVQQLSSRVYNFAIHTQTDISQMQAMANKAGNRFVRIQSFDKLISMNPHKVKINQLGEITEIC